MTNNSLELRRQKYFEISSLISQLDHKTLNSLFDQSESNESSTGWGMNHMLVFGESKVFVKRVPLTDVEYKNLFSTKNLYHLPAGCSYGINSTGLGVFRELITHLKTSQWVLEGAIANFPLMYHYRILPSIQECTALEIDIERWGNHANIKKYALDRVNARYELVLFLEHIPYVLETWLQENPSQLQKALNDIWRAIAFLRTKEIIHFDAHFRNILTDGEQVYLTDFGLALDKSFALTEEEEIFFEQNSLYDYGEVLRNLGHLIRSPYNACSENDKYRIMKKYGFKDGLQPYEVGAILLDNIQQIQADGDLVLDEFYVSSIVKYRAIIALMQGFFAEMWENDQKDTLFPHAKLRLLLSETRFLPI
ncbi:MAG TPA: protein kinase [Leptolyngbyaceae cyanobacterium M33_DOE_097]|nr:protein kinase [Leptolyngbyaceae cyanobacterium M33_DOE_097]